MSVVIWEGYQCTVYRKTGRIYPQAVMPFFAWRYQLFKMFIAKKEKYIPTGMQKKPEKCTL